MAPNTGKRKNSRRGTGRRRGTIFMALLSAKSRGKDSERDDRERILFN